MEQRGEPGQQASQDELQSRGNVDGSDRRRAHHRRVRGAQVEAHVYVNPNILRIWLLTARSPGLPCGHLLPVRRRRRLRLRCDKARVDRRGRISQLVHKAGAQR
jgi:hypothetical protein